MALKRRVVVVGLGSIGRRHARLLSERSDIGLEVLEPRREALELAFQQIGGPAPAHAGFDAMLGARPDVVFIATPTRLHADQTIAALDAAAHVFCEKPMSDTLADACRMKDAAGRCGKVLNIGFHLHFCQGLRALKALIDRGELGRVLHVHMRVGSQITLINSGSRYQRDQEGSLMLDYSHQPDLLYWMFGRIPKRVYAIGFQGGELELSSRPNVAVINCEYDSPFIATVHLNYVQMPERHEYEVVGGEAWALLDFNLGLLKVGRRKDNRVSAETFDTEKDNMIRAEQQAFFDAVDGLRPPETGAAAGLVSTAICEAAIESWRAGRPVAVPADAIS